MLYASWRPQLLLFLQFVLWTVPIFPVKSILIDPATRTFNKTYFNAYCKGPFVISCEACGLPVYRGGESKVANQCISAIVREKNGTSEKRDKNGRFTFDSSVTPLDLWIQYDGFEIRLLQFIAQSQSFYVALYDWTDWEETTLKNYHTLNISRDDPDVAKLGILALVGDDAFDMALGSFTASSQVKMKAKFSDGFLSMAVVLVQHLPPGSKEVHSIPFPLPILFMAFVLYLIYALLWSLAQSLGDAGKSNSGVAERCCGCWPGTWAQLGTSMLDIFGSIFNQGIGKVKIGENIGLSEWVVLSSWWLYVIIFIAVYTGQMTSKMSVTYGDASPVTGLSELAYNPDLLPIVKQDSVLAAWLEDRKDEAMYKEIWGKLMANPELLTDLSQGDTFKLIKSHGAGQYVLITSMKASFVYGRELLCESHIQPVNHRFWKAFPVAPNNAHLRYKLSQGIGKAMNTAVLSKLTRDFAIDTSPSCQKGAADFGKTSLSITNLDNSFIYFGYALFVCGSVALAEVLSSYCSAGSSKRYDVS
ncbi:hypothetical protein BV898_16254 [Hypsibius exemplaris]|uniref:Ionotropic glutamate receptor C-terminal domain-containing protein n=1 Tax=Hypsibius exemplaris TaxID=2072580 RepID=A0A9X6NFJ1_HYPEX|nr:hypothetical protein BV898_16254 [Hypsibius exemplaris]